MEHWESISPGGYRFVYDEAVFPPGTDSFLLSALPRLKAGMRVCDLGCGSGLLSLLLLQRQQGLDVTGVELDEHAAALAQRAAAENGLTKQMRVACGDLRQIRALLPAGAFDLVICNPPYYVPQGGKLSARPSLRTARAELTCTAEDVCAAAAYLLRWGGSFCVVHKPERLTDLLCALRGATLEPKRLRFVCPRPGTAPSLFLLEGRRGGRPGLEIPSPLVLCREDGSPTAELDAIYFRTEEDMP